VTGRPTEIGWSTVKEEARWAKAIRQVVRGGSRSRDSDGLSWPRVYQ
jgi:hypothetical protein